MTQKPRFVLQHLKEDLIAGASPETVFKHLEELNRKQLFEVLSQAPKHRKVEATKQELEMVMKHLHDRFGNVAGPYQQQLQMFRIQFKTRSKLLDGRTSERENVSESFDQFIKNHPYSLKVSSDEVRKLSKELAQEILHPDAKHKHLYFQKRTAPDQKTLEEGIYRYLYGNVEAGKWQGIVRADALLIDMISRTLSKKNGLTYPQAIAIIQTIANKHMNSSWMRGSLRHQFNIDLSEGKVVDSTSGSTIIADTSSSSADTTEGGQLEKKQKPSLIKNIHHKITKNPKEGYDFHVTWDMEKGGGKVKIEIKYAGAENMYSNMGVTESNQHGFVCTEYLAGDYKIKLTPVDDEGNSVGRIVVRKIRLDDQFVEPEEVKNTSDTIIDDETKDSTDEVQESVDEEENKIDEDSSPLSPEDERIEDDIPMEPVEEGGDDGDTSHDTDTETADTTESFEPLTEEERKEAFREVAVAFAYPMTKSECRSIMARLSKKYHTDVGAGKGGDEEVAKFIGHLYNDRRKNLDKLDLRHITGRDFLEAVVWLVNKHRDSFNQLELIGFIQWPDDFDTYKIVHDKYRNIFTNLLSFLFSKGTLRDAVGGWATDIITPELRAEFIAKYETEYSDEEKNSEDPADTMSADTDETHEGTVHEETVDTETTYDTTEHEEVIHFATNREESGIWKGCGQTSDQLKDLAIDMLRDMKEKVEKDTYHIPEDIVHKIHLLRDLLVYDGLNALQRIHELLREDVTGAVVSNELVGRFHDLYTKVLEVQKEEATTYIKKLQSKHKEEYAHEFTRWKNSLIYVSPDEKDYDAILLETLWDETFDTVLFKEAFKQRLLATSRDRTFALMDVAKSALPKYFSDRKQILYAEFGIGVITNAEEMRTLLNTWQAKECGKYTKSRWKEGSGLKEKIYRALIKSKDKEEQELLKHVRHSDAWKMFAEESSARGTMPDPVKTSTGFIDCSLKVTAYGEMNFTITRDGLPVKQFLPPTKNYFKVEEMVYAIASDDDLEPIQKRYAAWNFIHLFSQTLIDKFGDLHGSIGGKALTISTQEGLQVDMGGKMLLNEERLEALLGSPQFRERILMITSSLRTVMGSMYERYKSVQNDLELSDIRLHKAHNTISKTTKLIREVTVKRGEQPVQEWSIPEPAEYSLHCFKIAHEGANDIYYSHGKFYIVTGAGDTKSVKQVSTFKDLLQAVKDPVTIQKNYTQNLLTYYLQEKRDVGPHIFLKMHGNYYAINGVADRPVFYEVRDLKTRGTPHNLARVFSVLSENTSIRKEKLRNYAKDYKWGAQSDTGEGMFLMNYHKEVTRGGFLSKKTTIIQPHLNHTDLEISLNPLTSPYAGIYGNIEFTKLLAKMIDQSA